ATRWRDGSRSPKKRGAAPPLRLRLPQGKPRAQGASADDGRRRSLLPAPLLAVHGRLRRLVRGRCAAGHRRRAFHAHGPEALLPPGCGDVVRGHPRAYEGDVGGGPLPRNRSADGPRAWPADGALSSRGHGQRAGLSRGPRRRRVHDRRGQGEHSRRGLEGLENRGHFQAASRRSHDAGQLEEATPAGGDDGVGVRDDRHGEGVSPQLAPTLAPPRRDGPGERPCPGRRRRLDLEGGGAHPHRLPADARLLPRLPAPEPVRRAHLRGGDARSTQRVPAGPRPVGSPGLGRCLPVGERTAGSGCGGRTGAAPPLHGPAARVLRETHAAPELRGAPGDGPGDWQRPGGRRGEDVGVTPEAARGAVEAAERAADGEPGLRPPHPPVGRLLDPGQLITQENLAAPRWGGGPEGPSPSPCGTIPPCPCCWGWEATRSRNRLLGAPSGLGRGAHLVYNHPCGKVLSKLGNFMKQLTTWQHLLPPGIQIACLPGPTRKREPSPYCYRLAYRNPEPG